MKSYLFIVFIFLSHSIFSQSFDFLPESSSQNIVKHSYYTLSYSEKNEQAEWVAYLLTKKRTIGSLNRDNCKFISDPDVKTGSAKNEDYSKSGYDRGHLAPAADMRFNFTALNECFFMSNMSPQLHSFNAGIWKSLETQVRNWSIEKDSIYIITAGVLENLEKTIPNTSISIPKYFYKIILHKSNSQFEAVAFLLPHEKAYKPLKDYVVTIDSLENLTHIDFFASFPDSVELQFENKILLTNWHFTKTTTNTSTTKPSSNAKSSQCTATTKEGTRCKI
ncbi:MAG: DNA/RNA non-specific endonuclease [Bacteroidota bacterium]